eukprot:4733029-Amphidinium_carterae.1
MAEIRSSVGTDCVPTLHSIRSKCSLWDPELCLKTLAQSSSGRRVVPRARLPKRFPKNKEKMFSGFQRSLEPIA